MRIGDAADHAFSRVYAYLGTGVLYLRKGELTRAISAFERALTVGETTSIPVGFAYGASYLGYALALAGNHAEGVALLEQTAEQAIEMKFAARHSLRLAYLGEAYLLSGRPDEAAATAAKALELARMHKERAHEAYAFRLHGELAEHRGAAADAEAHYRSALAIAQQLGMRPLRRTATPGSPARSSRPARSAAKTQREAAAKLFRSMEMRVVVDSQIVI